jgi:nitrite reductase/ring-hydroxylating ferredoxin subunit/thioredoxin reductase
MTETNAALVGPDFDRGVPASAALEGAPLLGHSRGEPVIVVRRRGELFAVGALCTHYSGPLAEGLVDGDTVRCPWHHASFSLRTGEALRAPALSPVSCWQVEQRDGNIYVGNRVDPALSPRAETITAASVPKSIVIVGGGAAGNAAAEMLRREHYEGTITLLSADDSLPCDRPNLSKNYLSGSAPEEWIPLRSTDFYEKQRIDVRLNARAVAIDATQRRVHLEDGSHHDFDALLLATGAEPVRLDVPGRELRHVHYLRTWADSRALVAAATGARSAVVVGASFIGLEVAASLRARNIEVHVVGRETVLMERVLGAETGAFLRRLHEDHGVTFHLGATVGSIDERAVTLATGESLPADMVVVGIGVRPAIALAE